MQSEARSGRPVIGRPRSEGSREAILAAVRDLLLKGGYASLTFEGVAKRAGVSKATIYRWWRSKGELVLEASGDAIRIGLVPDTGDARADIVAAIDQLIGTFSNRLASIVIFAAITTAAEDRAMAQALRDRIIYPWRRSAAEALERAQERDELAHNDIVFLLDLIVGTVFQRTLVVKDPVVEGLKDNLMAIVLRRRDSGPTGSG
ncbi:TetR/AcrR family transcriptional regulator [Frigidibacter sp. RF13]|uniref:TetR/AcrR family transcriptional regulator n=1 Tax=Frigidibacter sp. RF13 TaxID=2997340 RepID=UPI00226E50CC|nr:TetR/AcrR family transcriptional regulator [Frigidibacter sp. RF13]